MEPSFAGKKDQKEGIMFARLIRFFSGRSGRRPASQETPVSEPSPAPSVSGSERQVPELLVGRQPMVNNRREIIAYQLLFRRDHSGKASDLGDGFAATGEVILNTLNNMGLERVLGDALAFVKLDRSMLDNPVLDLLPERWIVLDLIDWENANAETLDHMKALRARGFRFALTNFQYRDSYRDLVRLADFVKLNVHALNEEGMRREVRYLRGHGVRLVAERVETEQDLKLARSLYMNYYQGYFFARPETLQMRRVDPQAERVLRLFNLVLSDVKPKQVAQQFKQDVALSYNLLRYINSPGMGVPKEVSSIHHAIVMLGRTRLARWLSLLMVRESRSSAVPAALLRTALVRARLCEVLGARTGLADRADHLFMTGLFSLLDLLYGTAESDLVSSLNLPEPIQKALVEDTGPYAPYLELARACEAFDTERMLLLSGKLAVSPGELNRLHDQAMQWAYEISARDAEETEAAQGKGQEDGEAVSPRDLGEGGRPAPDRSPHRP